MKFTAKSRASAWRGRAALATTLLLGSWAAQACVIDATGMTPNSSARYWVYEDVLKPLTPESEIVGGGGPAATYVYTDCTPGATYSIHQEPDLVYSGHDYEGSAVFDVDDGVGIMFRLGSAEDSYLTAVPVGAGGVTRTVTAPSSGRIRMRIWFRYIATKNVGSRETLYPREYNWSTTNNDNVSLSSSKNVREDQISKFVPPPDPSCWFRGTRPGHTPLPHTTVGMLERNGQGPAKTFQWEFACNVEATRGAKVKYTPGTSYDDPKSGRMAIESGPGAAEGVELEVLRATSSGGIKEALEFGKVFTPGSSGTEFLEVRYVPTGAPLKPGVGNGSLVVELTVN